MCQWVDGNCLCQWKSFLSFAWVWIGLCRYTFSDGVILEQIAKHIAEHDMTEPSSSLLLRQLQANPLKQLGFRWVFCLS